MTYDANGVLAAIFDRANSAVRVTQVAGPSTDLSGADANGVWSGAYDPATNSIRIILV